MSTILNFYPPCIFSHITGLPALQWFDLGSRKICLHHKGISALDGTGLRPIRHLSNLPTRLSNHCHLQIKRQTTATAYFKNVKNTWKLSTNIQQTAPLTIISVVFNRDIHRYNTRGSECVRVLYQRTQKVANCLLLQRQSRVSVGNINVIYTQQCHGLILALPYISSVEM